MGKQPPSIFNDVIGPVMRGPSSSHTAAAVRIGNMIRQYFSGSCRFVAVEITPEGSLASTYSSQGSDFGLAGGLLGMSTSDTRLVDSLIIARENGMEIKILITDFEAHHPNTYRITAASGIDDELPVQFNFLSTGGGMFELTELDGLPVSVCGDYYERIYVMSLEELPAAETIEAEIMNNFPEVELCALSHKGEQALLNIKTSKPAGKDLLAFIQGLISYDRCCSFTPVLPVSSGKKRRILFEKAEQLLKLAEQEKKQLWEMALEYESCRGDLTPGEVETLAAEIIAVMKESVKSGLAGTDYSDRILGPQAQKLLSYQGRLFGGSAIKQLIAYVTAVMETKSAMGVIVAAPTAGACAALPGSLLASAEELDVENSDKLFYKGLLAAAAVGLVIAHQSTFAAEECGCQAECGSASAMAAAGLTQMAGGNAGECLAAASMALQNIIGMVCDPVANRVEVPCLGKNVLAAVNALVSANMALSGFDQVIPLDQTIAAFDQAGRMLPAELRCTGKAGLSTTQASIKLQNRLAGKADFKAGEQAL